MEPKALKKARVMTRPKSNTLDPQGVVVKSNLERSLGIKYLKKVSIGRYIEVELGEKETEKFFDSTLDKFLTEETDDEIMLEDLFEKDGQDFLIS